MDLSATLKEGIATWLNASPRRNLRLLERFTGVSYSTLRRLQAGERTPTPESIIPLCEVIFDREQTTKVLATHYPKMLSFFENVILHGNSYQNKEDGSSPRIDRVNFLIFAYCSSGKKVDRTEVARLWGIRGISILQELLDSEILREEHGAIFNPVSSIIFSSRKDPCEHVAALLEFHSKPFSETEKRQLVYEVAAVDQKTYTQLCEAQSDYLARQSEILSGADDKSGTFVYYSAIFTGTIREGKQNEN